MFSFGRNNGDAATGSGSMTEAELRRKEADLAQKEARLKALEKELGGRKKRNWPVCLPLWYHDIGEEIPERSRRAVRYAYMAWWGLVICMTFQVVCASIMLGYKNAGDRVASWFLAIIYWVLGVPLGMVLWYRRLYNAARDDGTVGYFAFFLFFLVHIGWCVWCTIAFPFSSERWSFSGFIAGIEAFDISNAAGTIYMIAASCWAVESLWSIYCLKDTYYFFRGAGGVKEVQSAQKNAAALAAFQQASGRA